jgi:hypothetical protein
MARPKNVQDDIVIDGVGQEEIDLLTASAVNVEAKEEKIVEQPTQKLYTPEEVEKLMNDKFAALEEKLLKSQPKPQIVEKVVQTNSNPFAKGVNSDDLPELKNWEVKNRTYVALTNTKAISMNIRSKHKSRSPLQYFNKEKGTQHALRYATNEASFFIENQSNNAIASHILMLDGFLEIPAHEVNLQKFLAIHPDNEIVFKELDERAEALKRTEELDFYYETNKKVREISYEKQKAVAILVCKNYNQSWSPEEIKAQLRYETNVNPYKVAPFLADPNIEIKAIAKNSVAKGLILYDNYRFMKPNKEVMCTVPIGVNEWDAFVSYATSVDGRIYYDFLKNQF